MKQCLNCNTIIKGRADKKFCSKECSNKYHANIRKKEANDVVKVINQILLKNYKILVELLEKQGKQKLKVNQLVLVQLGFNFKYMTGIYTNSKGKLYHYVYDCAWMEFSDQEVMIVRKKEK